MSEFQCLVCGEGPAWRWTDTHGVAVHACGMPYRILHYDEDNKRVEQPPSTTMLPEWIPVAQAYWRETGQRVFPGTHDIGILSGRDASYSGATKSQADEFWEWVEKHPDLVPKGKK